MPRIASLLLALQAAAAPTQPPAPPAQPAATPSASAGTPADTVARADSARGRRRPPPRRAPVTPELERTAFADAHARTMLLRARAARVAQDSALRGYDAKTYQRLSVGMGVKRLGPERLAMRTENAARVRWSRDVGLWLEPTGRRYTMPILKGTKDADADFSMDEIAPIPYFPGRETLWFPSGDMGVARAEVDEREMLHPLATGAEAYYRYASGDSLTIRLPDGRAILLRELRITARRPEWRAFVGSFWFDAGSGHLVRAAYRMAKEMDIWQVVDEENSADLRDARARASTDTSAAAREAVRRAEREVEDDVPKWVKAMMNPMRANISAITVEYGLHEGRFWMPRRNVAEGEAQAGFLRVPVKVEETFKYASVNGDAPVPPLPESRVRTRIAVDSALLATMGDDDDDVVIDVTIGSEGRRRGDTTLAGRIARMDSLARVALQRSDSLKLASAAARVRGDTAVAARDSVRARTYARRADARARSAEWLRRRERECAAGDSYVSGVRSRYDGAVRMAVRMPCDTSVLSRSPDLPPSAYEKGEQLFGEGEREELLKALDLGLQPGWAPEKPHLRSGLDLVRYDRVEGLSVGALATAALGKGYVAQAQARIGTADWVPNGELSITRSNGRVSWRVGAFHRLGIANDDWSGPLTFGASVASLLYARDEGFYYRTWGAELAGTRDLSFGGATLGWRVFAERQRSAGAEPNTQANLLGVFGDTKFVDNIDAVSATALGVGGDVGRGWGLDPDGWRLATRARAEAAWVDASGFESDGYGRAMAEATVSRGFGDVAASLTGSAGTSLGTLPPQRAFYVGGLQTVRGQFASPTAAGQVGDAFWLARTELGLNRTAFRPVVFYDIGWAGSRDEWSNGVPLSGAGVGASFFDGLVRLDVSRGIRPDARWRFDMSVDARF